MAGRKSSAAEVLNLSSLARMKELRSAEFFGPEGCSVWKSGGSMGPNRSREHLDPELVEECISCETHTGTYGKFTCSVSLAVRVFVNFGSDRLC